MTEEDSPLEIKARELRAKWFETLTDKDRDSIIKAEFKRRFPNWEAIKKLRRDLD